MTPWNSREIARRLAERDDVEPPEGLLETIKSEIPATLPALHAVRESDGMAGHGGQRMPRRRIWLMAASLAAVVVGGLLGLRMMQRATITTARQQESAGEAPARAPQPAVPAVPPPPVAAKTAPAPEGAGVSADLDAARPEPETAQQAAKEKKAETRRSDLKSLGYLADRRLQPSQVPRAASPPPPPRPPVPAAKAAAAPEEQITIMAESVPASGVKGGVAGGAPGGVAGGGGLRKDAAPPLDERRRDTRDPWGVLQTTPGVATDRINVGGNESGQQSEYASPAPERRSLAAGRLPPPGAVRVEDFVSSFSYGDEPPVRDDFAVHAEGAPTAFATDAGTRLLRFNIRGREARTENKAAETRQTIARNAGARVEFNPEVVSRWRLVGSEDRAALTREKPGGDIGPAGQVGAGQSVTALYEVHLKPGVSGSQTIATLHLRFRAADGGRALEITRDLRVADLAPSWEKAPPGLRLASLAAELAEVLKDSTGAKSAGLDDLLRRARQLSAELAKSPQAAEAADLVRMVEETVRLKRQK